MNEPEATTDLLKVDNNALKRPDNEIELIKLYVEPYEKVSKKVEKRDIKTIIDIKDKLKDLCNLSVGRNKGALAIAHCQVTKKDPLCFFITNTGEIIINPVITRHTRHTVDSEEGCMSFPFWDPINVPRYHKCEVEYLTLDEDNNFVEKTENISGTRAKMFQHEIQHFQGSFIYDNWEKRKKELDEEREKLIEYKKQKEAEGEE